MLVGDIAYVKQAYDDDQSAGLPGLITKIYPDGMTINVTVFPDGEDKPYVILGLLPQANSPNPNTPFYIFPRS